MSKSSKPKKTSAEKALEQEASRNWGDVKDRFWPQEERMHAEGQRVGLGRKVREEGAVGANPMAYNPYGGGVMQAPTAAAAGQRMLGLRQNEQDRKKASTVNTIMNQREIQGQGMAEMAGAAGLQNRAAINRADAKNAATNGLISEVGNLAGMAGGAYLAGRQPGLNAVQKQQNQYLSGGGTYYGP